MSLATVVLQDSRGKPILDVVSAEIAQIPGIEIALKKEGQWSKILKVARVWK